MIEMNKLLLSIPSFSPFVTFTAIAGAAARGIDESEGLYLSLLCDQVLR